MTAVDNVLVSLLEADSSIGAASFVGSGGGAMGGWGAAGVCGCGSGGSGVASEVSSGGAGEKANQVLSLSLTSGQIFASKDVIVSCSETP